ncbi:hypothetical protein PoB_005365500 [Plakobranchus ocellatus]|uniref:Secreted protein n=1 Tax=Plakobranchus ocellatus TaxID=259542 RepID=A0AAV4C6T6_9GAST|nr:hypothetical protein PoB_005365500 [Plakobranchus ocellatus]
MTRFSCLCCMNIITSHLRFEQAKGANGFSVSGSEMIRNYVQLMLAALPSSVFAWRRQGCEGQSLVLANEFYLHPCTQTTPVLASG